MKILAGQCYIMDDELFHDNYGFCTWIFVTTSGLPSGIF
jgi:hypothetical protein